jgi:hypothetical protein
LRQILQSDRTAQLAQSRDKIIVLILACLRVECARQVDPWNGRVDVMHAVQVEIQQKFCRRAGQT